MTTAIFKDRFEAGRVLAKLLEQYTDRADTVVLALPRGGVPVAFEVSSYLNINMNLFFVKKIPSPWNEEAGIGAVAQNGMVWLNSKIIERLGIGRDYIERRIREKLDDIEKKMLTYRIDPADIDGKRVILVDDGIATGSSMILAASAVKSEGAAEVVIAAPVAPVEIKSKLEEIADSVTVVKFDNSFMAVGQYYEDFHQLDDKEVMELLNRRVKK